MTKLQPLKNPLEDRVTVLRVYRSIYSELKLTPEEWGELCKEIYDLYKELGGTDLGFVNQKRHFGTCKYKRKVRLYPIEFIPVITNLIKLKIK